VVSFMSLPLSPQGNSPQYALHRMAGWAPEPVWTRYRRGKFPAPSGIVQPVVSSYTDSAIPAHHHVFFGCNKCFIFIMISLSKIGRELFSYFCKSGGTVTHKQKAEFSSGEVRRIKDRNRNTKSNVKGQSYAD
jgi:hypothetical protein